MRIGYAVGYWKQGPPRGALRAIRAADRLGYESVWTAEAYGSDAFTPLAWWGSHTKQVKLGTGIAQLSEDIDGAFIALGDMPRIRPAHIEALAGAFDPAGGRAICVPTWERRRGNPVLFARRYFPEMRVIEGDTGARALLEKHTAAVCHVPMPDRGVTLDVDTPEALESLSRP